jgi:RND family efflux transporter MFP subunit
LAIDDMKKWFVTVLVLAVGWFGYQQWHGWRAKLEQLGGVGRPTTSPVIQTNISFAVNAAGEIGPVEQVSVRPEINGLINKLPVDLGDTVRKGDLLFGLDDKELQNQRASIATEVQRAKLQLEQAERNHKRAEELFASTLISQELYENTKTEYELARNSLERAQKELAVIEERLTKTQVMAPFDCTVLTRPVSIGQAVSGSGGFNSGTEVLTIADLNSMIINAHVNQADVPRMKVAQEVEVTVEAVADLKITGTVERIAPQATIKNNIKGFAVRVLLKNVDQRVRPGMTANVRIPVAEAEHVLAVPLAAVFTERNPDTQQMERFVYVQKGERFERRDVQIGVSDFFYAEAQSGLSPGDVVALELPKEEREKQAKNLAGMRPGGAENTGLRTAGSAPAMRPGAPAGSGGGVRPGTPAAPSSAGTPRPGGPGGAPPSGAGR